MQDAAEVTVDFDSVLERLRAESLRHFAAASVRVEPRRVLVRPFSQVMEVEIDAGGRTTSAFVKILKPRLHGAQELEATRRNITREFDTTARMHARFASHAGLSTARPIACYPELLAMVTERVEGVSLLQRLSSVRGFPSPASIEALTLTLRKVGTWLSTFQAIDALDGTVSLDQLRTYLDRRLQPLADGGVIGADVRTRLLRYFDQLAAQISASDLQAVPVHADFTPENVIIRDGDVTVLDFTMAKRGTRYLDLAHMWMYLDRLKARPWFRPAVVDALTTALVAGFDPQLQTDRPLFQLQRLEHVVCHLRQMQESPPALATRLYAEFLRRRHLSWLLACGVAPSHSH
jgi:Phosphotransferase enzyme family